MLDNPPAINNMIHNFLELVKMSTLEDKLEAIELKVMKLVEQNLQFKEICEDLLQTRRQLEKENAALKAQLTAPPVPVQKPNKQADASQTEERHPIGRQLATPVAADKERIKQQIDQYIQAINNSIEWLGAL